MGLLALGVWCFLLNDQMTALKAEIARLRRDLAPPADDPLAAAERAADPAATEAPLAPAAPRLSPPSAFTAAPDTEAALAAARSLEPPPAPPPPSNDQGPSPERPNAPGPSAPVDPRFAPAPRRAPSRASAADWLSENGLAWIGGGALALGGLLLVAYAAEHGFFTPALRIICALGLGGAALLAGEALRRRRPADGREPPLLVAALTTAAGAAVLYAAVWAAHALYGFIPAGVCALALCLVSLGLLALAFLHGEPLGLLALAGAYAAPLTAGTGAFGAPTLDVYLLLILATGLAATALRGWAKAGGLTLALGGACAAARLAAGDAAGALLPTILAPALSLAALEFAGRRGPARPELGRLFIGGVIGAGGLAAMIGVFGARPQPDGALAAAALAVVVMIAVRRGRAPGLLHLAPGAVVVAFALAATLRRVTGPAPLEGLAAALVVAATALFARKGSDGRAGLVGAGAAALALTLAAPALAVPSGGGGVVADLTFAAALGLGAILRDRAKAEGGGDEGMKSLVRAAFVAAAAQSAGLAVHAAVAAGTAPLAYGLLGVALAVLAARVGWRGFAASAAVACLAALAALLGPKTAGAALRHEIRAPLALLIALGAAGPQTLVWGVLRRRAPGAADAASTVAVISSLLGVFLCLEGLGAAPGAASPLSPFARAALEVLLVLAAGASLSIRAETSFQRGRAAAFLGAGAVIGLIGPGWVQHPWWGRSAAPVAGPPLADMILIAFMAPAALLAVFALRAGRTARISAAAAAAAAAAFALLYAVTEIRRLFHGALLADGAFLAPELAAYGAAALGITAGVDALEARGGRALGRLAEAGALALLRRGALVAGAVAFLYLASPWWGPLDAPLAAPGLLFLLYAAGAGLILLMGRSSRRRGRVAEAGAALGLAGAVIFALITLLVRYLFHGPAMREPLREAGVETWTFSAVWAVYGLVGLAVGAQRRDAALRTLGLVILLTTTAKVFLFDMAKLEGVIRAGSFLALGVVLLLGALAARRFRRPSPLRGDEGAN